MPPKYGPAVPTPDARRDAAGEGRGDVPGDCPGEGRGDAAGDAMGSAEAGASPLAGIWAPSAGTSTACAPSIESRTNGPEPTGACAKSLCASSAKGTSRNR